MIATTRRRAAQLPLAAEALLTLMAAWLAVRFLPFRHAIALGARPLSRESCDMGTVWRIRRMIDRLSARVPWRAVCIERGIAMQRMLRRRGFDARLQYGAAMGPAAALSAHVWVTLADQIVIGEDSSDDYARLASFPS